ASFKYNWNDELITASRYGEVESYSYLPSGGFKSFNGALPQNTSAQTNLIPRSRIEKPYLFDEFGNLESNDRVKKTEFDGFGRLVRAETASDVVEFGYDDDGRRIYKIVKPKNATLPALQSLYPLETLNIEPKGPESFVFVGDQRLARIEHASKNWFFYLKDHLGSSDIMMDRSGKPVEQMLYKSYGTEVDVKAKSSLWSSYLDTNAEILPKEKTHHRFTGQYLDDDTGLYYYGARYYDAELGRFISADPHFIENPEGCLSSTLGVWALCVFASEEYRSYR
ncbi:MAG: RHS repeat-associated core domain-containing protein, partial [Proteobacteria bacterium]